MVVGSQKTPQPTTAMQWTRFGREGGWGVLATGAENGSISLWDVQGIIEKSPKAILFSKTVHEKTPVMCMEFNEKNPSLLASGGRSLRLQDLNANLKTGEGIFKPGTSENINAGFISALSWHPSIDGLIASADTLGNVVVWNLK